MQWIYVLNYSVPERLTLTVDGKVEIDNEYVERLLKFINRKPSECSWLVSDRPLKEIKNVGTITDKTL